jgi:chromosomal replication initiator protein
MKITEPKQLWKVVLAQIEIKLDAPAQFKMFFSETNLISVDGKTAIIGVPNPYTAEWIKSKYKDLVKDVLSYVYGSPLVPEFRLHQNTTYLEDLGVNKSDSVSESLNLISNDYLRGNIDEILLKSGLNPRYTITNYVVGNANRIAQAAAMAVVTQPGLLYNPLFIYGKTGVGKTHLAQAVGRAILEKNLQKKILYVPSETFMNDLVYGIKSGSAEKMRNKYRPIDVLIVDDIQLISKWVHTQTEFFNTFNELHNNSKQIILISDRRPEDIQNLEARLKSRMQGGMVVEISQPDYEMRLAILQNKAHQTGANLKPVVMEFIARAVTDNIRELEGALQKVALFNQMKPNGDLTLEEIAHAIGKDTKSKREQVKIPKVLKEVSKSFGVLVKDLKGPRRTKDLALARQVAMYILREEYRYKLEEVARFLNRDDHTTVIHAIDKVKSKMMLQEGFNNQVAKIISNISDSISLSDEVE